jgi:ribonuclease P protein component
MTRVAGCDGDPPRVAFAVGKTTGNAVVRNRLRRQLRAVVRDHANEFVPGSVYLVGAGPQAATATYQDLDRALTDCLAATARTS